MIRHPYFDLLLHDDAELALLLGSAVLERVTLHEWPLSCVQRLTLAYGQHWIYKSQREPTIEAAFYAQARSGYRARGTVLPQARALYDQQPYSILLLEYLDAPRLDELEWNETQARAAVKAVLEGLARIERAPVWLDISTPERWRAEMAQTLDDLRALVAAGTFHVTDRAALRRIEQAAAAPSTLAVYQYSPTGLVHGDLRGENVFQVSDGYRVIDWQRPFLGPTLLDLASLLESLGVDPRPHMPPGVQAIHDLLHIRWLAQCARRWFPPGSATYDAQIAQIAAGGSLGIGVVR